MLSKSDIAQLMSDQVTAFSSSLAARKRPAIEFEPFDDAEGIGYDPLNRWGDRKFKLKPHSWTD